MKLKLPKLMIATAIILIALSPSWRAGNGGEGISLVNVSNALLENNVVSRNGVGVASGDGIALRGSVANTIRGNTISENNGLGVRLDCGANGNRVYHNNFIDNKYLVFGLRFIQALVHPNCAFNNLFDNGLPDGGNYWSDYDTPAEGCNDANTDGICDAPYFILWDTQDRYPWLTQDGWKG